MTEDPQIWSSVFYWRNYDGEPTLEWPQAKFIIYTKFVDRYNTPKIVGYIQFGMPIKSDMLATISDKIYWTEQKFSNSACMRYIEKINAGERGELTILGEHWPIKSYTPAPTPPPSVEEQPEPQQPQLKKRPTSLLKKNTAQPWKNERMWTQPTLENTWRQPTI